MSIRIVKNTHLCQKHFDKLARTTFQMNLFYLIKQMLCNFYQTGAQGYWFLQSYNISLRRFILSACHVFIGYFHFLLLLNPKSYRKSLFSRSKVSNLLPTAKTNETIRSNLKMNESNILPQFSCKNMFIIQHFNPQPTNLFLFAITVQLRHICRFYIFKNA